MNSKLIKEISRLINHNQLAFGSEVKRFEREFSKISNYEFNIAYNSASSAAFAIFSWLYKKYGSCKVYTPTIGFASPAWAAYKAGHDIIFTDVDDHLLMTLKQYDKELLKNNKAILMPVLYGGVTNCNIASKYKNPLVIDSAHSPSNIYCADNYENYSFYSFHPSKPIAMSQGGIIGTNDNVANSFFLKFRNFGRENITNEYYDITQDGYKFYMTNLDATIGLDSLKKAIPHRILREAQHKIYKESLSDLGYFLEHNEDSWHYLCTLVLDKPVAKKIRQNLSLPLHYPLLHQTTFWKQIKKQPILPNAENLVDRIINLPIHHNKNLYEIWDLIKGVKQYL